MQQLLDNNSLRSLSACLPHLDCPTHLMDHQTNPAVQRRLPHSFTCLAPKGLPACLPVLPFRGVKSNKYVGANLPLESLQVPLLQTAQLCVYLRAFFWSLAATGRHLNTQECECYTWDKNESKVFISTSQVVQFGETHETNENLAFKKFESSVTFRRKYKSLK